MTQRTLPTTLARGRTPLESGLVLGSVVILSALAVADRFTAWLIGEFPTYALFWRIRFEFLRPIGVYYDMLERQFGDISPASYSTLFLLVATLIAAGVVSRIRLARAISCHLVLAAAAVLGVMSWDPGFTLRPHAQVGMTSQPYALLGIALAAGAAGLCLRIHVEYVGWKPASWRVVRLARIVGRRLTSRVLDFIGDLVEPLNPTPDRTPGAFAAIRATSHRKPR